MSTHSGSIAPSVIVILADGVRPDTLARAMDDGLLPAMGRIRDEGGPGSLATITSCFPSVTGPAYAPFLMGRLPGGIGVPGLRWFDRSRTRCTAPDYCRSYVGYQLSRLDGDIDPAAPTIFELTDRPLAAVSLIARGLPERKRIGSLSVRTSLRVAYAHFTGDIERAFANDREVAEIAVRRVREERPDFAFLAFGTPDKSSHAFGHQSPRVLSALANIDYAVARIRADAEKDGRWAAMHLWITSDHGHSPVERHDELADVLRALGYRTLVHPWTLAWRPDVALMVSGNAMAHVYLEPARRDRPLWPAAGARWTELVEDLESRPSVDLLILPSLDGAIVRSADRGRATVRVRDGHYSYARDSGDPLALGRDFRCLTAHEAYCVTLASDYPDGVVQIASLARSSRAGEIILSAARGWDFRARHEPITHVSSHGALHREHMLVPLLMNRPRRNVTQPMRTVDLMPSALALLGRPVPAGLDGRSFVGTLPE